MTRPSPAKKVAGHIFSQLCRPSRLRGRFLLLVVILTGLLFLHLGHRHADDIQRTAWSLSAYVPTQFTKALAHDQELGSTLWNDSKDPDLQNRSTSSKDPTFHLLIPASKPTLNLCRTLLSAAILNYPPPTLLGYGQEGDRDRSGVDVVRSTVKVLKGKDIREDDLVLVVDEDTLFQLPAEVLINRFFYTIRDSTYALLQKYGRYPGNFTTLRPQQPQRYYSHVLFGAQKDCTSSPSSPACFFAPQSPLPKDSHDPYSQQESEHKRPRYLASAMTMGTAGHLRPIYKYANELLETGSGRKGSQHIFSQVFGAQEYHRERYHQSTLSSLTKASQWIASNLGSGSKYQRHQLDHPTRLNNSSSSESGSHCEFGIGLDYTSSVFQIIDSPSEVDMEYLKFSNVSKSLNLCEKLTKKIHLPTDLNLTSPFNLHSPSKEPVTEFDNLPSGPISWSDVALATNTLIPESPIVPSILNFHNPSPHLNDSTAPSIPSWDQLWYHSYSRALLRQSLRAPSTPITAIIPPLLPLKPAKSKLFKPYQQHQSQDVQYTDLRGGRGGVWTDKGEWLEWNEVCGNFDAKVFGDGKGVFGKWDVGESEKEGGK